MSNSGKSLRIGNLPFNRATWEQKIQALPCLVTQMNNEDKEHQLEAATHVKSILAVHGSPIEKVVSAGCVPKLVEFLSYASNPDMQFEAAWAITNVCSGNDPAHTEAVVNIGGVKFLYQIATSTNASNDLKEQAIWALSNIAADTIQARDKVLQEGCLPCLLSLLGSTTNAEKQRTYSWALSNFFYGSPTTERIDFQAVLSEISRQLHFPDDQVTVNLCYAIVRMVKAHKHSVSQHLSSTDIVKRLMQLLSKRDSLLVSTALGAIENISNEGNDFRTMLIDAGFLAAVKPLIDHYSFKVRKSATYALYNIASGTEAHVQSVIDAELFPLLIRLTSQHHQKDSGAAVLVLAEATSGNERQIEYLVNQGAIPAMCCILNDTDLPASFIESIFDGVHNILQSGRQEHDTSKYTEHFKPFDAKFRSLQQRHAHCSLAGILRYLDAYKNILSASDAKL